MGDQPYADPTMHPPLGQWNTLYHKASSVIRHSGGSPREFIEELVSVGVASHFRHLLIFNEQKKNAPTRTEVQSGSIHFPEGEMSIDKSVIPQIIGIADTLQVDEKYACVLYYKSIEKQYRYSGWSLPTIAESLYNEERKYQLMLLCELLQFVNSNDSEHEAFVEIVKGFFELVGIEELFQELLAQLYKHAESNKILSSVVVANPPLSSQAQSFAQMTSSSSAIPQSPTTSTNCYAEEMVLLSDALFYLIYAFPTKDFYIGRFLDFLLMLTTKLRQQPLGDDKKNSFFLEPPEAVYHPAVFHTASSVMTGVLVMLFRSDEAPGPLLEVGGLGPAPSVGAGIGTGIVGGGSGRETGTQGPNLLCTPCPNPLTTDVLLSLNAKFMQFLDSYQPVSFHCAVLFFYLVFLDRNNATLCRDNLTKIAVALLNEPQAVDTAVTVLSEDAMFFMAQVLQKESIIAEYDFTNVAGALFYQLVGLFMKKSHYSRLYNPQTVKPRAFHAFFRFLASTFKAAPYLAVNFWGENFNQSYSYLNMLVTVSERHLFSNEKFGEKIWLSFLDLLTNSVVTADSGYQAYQFFDKLRMNWDYIFKGMAAYVHDFNPNAYTQFGLIGGLVGAGPGVSAIPARPLSPADVRSWENLFAFMTAVLEHSEAVRSLIGDNPSWQAIGTVFQFLMCPVPISLKAKMVSTIAAFAKSERFSSLIWELLDQSDLVTNAPDPAPIASSQSLALKRRESLVYELVWNESVMHEYPLTRAFLRMISELIKWPLPRTLGVGKRASGAIGLQPYLAFITQEVFVKFPVRGYKDLSEMWTVATECLSILHSLLENYKYNDLDSTDQFTEINGRRTLLPKQPAFMLVRDISSSDSEIFKKIVYIIEQGADTLMHKREELRHAAIFEQAVQLSLQVLISIFIHVESASLPFNLGQHLVSGIRPCAIYVAKLVGYPAYTKIPLLSVELLSCLTKTQFGLARMFYAHEERATFISALAEQLNNTEREFIAEDVVDNIDGFLKDQDLRAGSLKLAIVRFLLENITRAKPNVAQFYLGLISDFGEPDLSSNTCFNTIINKLADPDALCSTEPQLAEGCYELLYRLCADPDFCEICLEYLRDPKTNFFNTQLDLMPVETPLSFISTTYEIFARAWLFKLVAIEMYMMANNRTYVSDMLKILFSDRNGIDAADAAHEMITSRRSTAHRYILQHLSVLDYPTKEQHLPPPSFPAQMYETVPRTTNFRGVTIADLPTLVQLLIERSSQTFPGDPSSVLVKTDAEMFDILNYFRQQNLNENLMRGKIFFFASWKQLIETILYSCAAYFECVLRL